MKYKNIILALMILLVLIPSALANPENISPVGTISYYAGTTAPASHLFANGSIVLKSTYPDLCNVLGSTYGINNASHCQLPNITQRFVLGRTTSGYASTLGFTDGQINHTHTADPPLTSSSVNGTHTHTVTTGSQAVGILGLLSTGAPANELITSSSSGSHLHTTDILSFNTGANNPPFIVLNPIIKAIKDDILFDPIDLDCSSFNSPSSSVACAGTSRFFNGTVRQDVNFDYEVRNSSGAVIFSGATTKIASFNSFTFTTTSTPQFYYATIYNNTYGWNDTQMIQTQFVGLTAEQNTTLYSILSNQSTINNNVLTVGSNLTDFRSNNTEEHRLTRSNLTQEITNSENLITTNTTTQFSSVFFNLTAIYNQLFNQTDFILTNTTTEIRNINTTVTNNNVTNIGLQNAAEVVDLMCIRASPICQDRFRRHYDSFFEGLL